MDRIAYLRAMRARAFARRDWAQVRALDADLERADPQPPRGRSYGLESVAAEPAPERVVTPLPRRRGRPRKRPIEEE